MAMKRKSGDTRPAGSKQPDDGLVKFAEVLLAIDTNSKLATLNATTIADNNGGRIEL